MPNVPDARVHRCRLHHFGLYSWFFKVHAAGQGAFHRPADRPLTWFLAWITSTAGPHRSSLQYPEMIVMLLSVSDAFVVDVALAPGT